ncbi:hypothetical protein D3C79_1018130 [compost metagenome]
MIDIAHVLGRYFGHIGAAAHFHGDQPFGREDFQGFAQRRAADSELLSDLEFVDPGAGFQHVLEDLLAQLLGNLLVEGGGG